MLVKRRLSVPTGTILVVGGDHGDLELISVADYGKEKNLKADFLGLTRDVNGVPHGDTLPLSEKWVITVSTQYGCSMRCTYCDVPMVGPGKNATIDDITNQVTEGLRLPQGIITKRLNIHFARMGEPTWNSNVLTAARMIAKLKDRHKVVHPVVSTMMPKRNGNLAYFISKWIDIKNNVTMAKLACKLASTLHHQNNASTYSPGMQQA